VATYAVGDIQGCAHTFERLLERVAFDPHADRLWCVGDLVNRGPDSLTVLRRLRGLGDRVVAVLGNHDLHLLRVAAGGRSKRRDTLESVLCAPDRDVLLGWLRRRPVLHQEGGFLMVHAGLLPSWSVHEAVEAARCVEARLGTGDPLSVAEEEALAALTRLRFVDEQGRPDYGPKMGPEEAPPGLRPWFEARLSGEETVVFGHWSTLGLYLAPGYAGLDTGCVWGGALTAYRLEDGAVFMEPGANGESGL